MGLLFIAGIYFFARGIFALFGQTIFYTRRSLEQIDPADLPAYLKEVGIWHLLVGVVFVGKALLDIPFPGSRPLLLLFCALLLVCVVFLSKANEKYIKK